jgi:hypothetical protein
MTEDSFEKARKAFFETPMAIRKVNAPPTEHADPRNQQPRIETQIHSNCRSTD